MVVARHERCELARGFWRQACLKDALLAKACGWLVEGEELNVKSGGLVYHQAPLRVEA